MKLQSFAAPLLCALALATTATPGRAATSASEQTCRACHTLDTTKVGPPFRAIAAHYRNDSDALAKLQKSMLESSSGKWGGATMPPNAISADDAARFAKWIMSLNRDGK
ncbi:MAG: c-type cytochrome [Burkholderia sp.]|uniref:c-type cytochrome n=1 Tax=Burkholderia sp. TaxID=36773 RepID=UPI002589485F|nr:c-type cytochrome [Burkholderia sp.]MCA3782083.1 c-type cytochrome [Burkholderia sp.]MCA3787607.1 c-type cytochrome [Burkholderia sp.]MCA3793266.1 c-type cytochrome [Burkholderia sp.]MCA3800408.1 c-type cytochrome [Burkholderia sp.]MCA3812977.1 c-type cytochrome [Burkholderia sp.]